MYADDLTIVDVVNIFQNTENLQFELDKLVKWVD